MVDKDFAPPPSHSVVWVILDRKNTDNMRTGFAQTAYQAYEASGIQRDGQRLSYGDCHVFYSECLTRKYTIEKLFELLAALTKKRKSNGRA
jgi:hypothetical protein